MCWRAANALISYVTYLQRYFWPVGLVVCYPRLPLDLPTWEVWSSLAILLGVTAVAVAYRRGLPYLAVGWFWYLGMLIPTIGLLQVGTVAVADRFTYLPQIGLGIALAWSAGRPVRLVVTAGDGDGSSRIADRAGTDGVCLAANIVFARQRDALETRPGVHLAE